MINHMESLGIRVGLTVFDGAWTKWSVQADYNDGTRPSRGGDAATFAKAVEAIADVIRSWEPLGDVAVAKDDTARLAEAISALVDVLKSRPCAG